MRFHQKTQYIYFRVLMSNERNNYKTEIYALIKNFITQLVADIYILYNFIKVIIKESELLSYIWVLLINGIFEIAVIFL